MNAGNDLFELIGVLNSTAGDESRSPEAAGFTTVPELTNRWYRAYRLTVPPGGTVRHEHSTPVVLVQTTVGTGVGSGRRVYGFNQPTGWGYFEVREPHELRNTGTMPVEFVEVEVRQPSN